MPDLEDPLSLACEIGDQICEAAEPVDGGCRWVSRHDEAEHETYATGVYMGATGIAIYLLNLFARTGNDRYRDTALKALVWLEGRVTAGDEGLAGPGLYEGRGALVYLYLQASGIVGDAALLQRAAEHARACAAMEQQWTELLYGTAGIGLLFLAMHRATPGAGYREWAEAAGDRLLQLAEPIGEGCRWLVCAPGPEPPPWKNRCFTGMAHGAAGNGYFLAELFRVTEAARFAECVRAAARRLLEVAHQDGPVWEWDCLDPHGGGRLVQWCHGAPGNGLFFLRAYEALGDPELREGAERCAEATLAAGDIRENPSQCHGLCGNAELFLEMYRALDDPRYLQMAREFGGAALRYRRESERGVEWQSHAPGSSTPDYLIGSAGVGQFYLRLADPKATPMPLLGIAS